MDKAGEAMLEGMIMFAAIVALAVAGIVWLIRRSIRNRRAQDRDRSQASQPD